MKTVRLVTSLTSLCNWYIYKLNINNAFLEEDVYLTLPPGVTPYKIHQVWKLIKSLYILKQASRKWYEKLTLLIIQNKYQ